MSNVQISDAQQKETTTTSAVTWASNLTSSSAIWGVGGLAAGVALSQATRRLNKPAVKILKTTSSSIYYLPMNVRYNFVDLEKLTIDMFMSNLTALNNTTLTSGLIDHFTFYSFDPAAGYSTGIYWVDNIKIRFSIIDRKKGYDLNYATLLFTYVPQIGESIVLTSDYIDYNNTYMLAFVSTAAYWLGKNSPAGKFAPDPAVMAAHGYTGATTFATLYKDAMQDFVINLLPIWNSVALRAKKANDGTVNGNNNMNEVYTLVYNAFISDLRWKDPGIFKDLILALPNLAIAINANNPTFISNLPITKKYILLGSKVL